MYCPVDRTIELVTISVDGISIEQCGKCNGHWLQHGELARLAQRDANVEPVVSITRLSIRPCPEDGTPLTEVEFPEHSGLRVDVCPKCQGIWLDAYELGQALTLLGRTAPHPKASAPTSSVLDMLARLTGKRRTSS
ncbi:MAG: zf-TFIIB domain-containing protein [Chloroflexota bacterium]